MKKYFNAFIMISLLNLTISTIAMQKSELDPSEMLPNEMWKIILEFLYFDQSMVNAFPDIHEALAHIKDQLPLASKNLRLTCKTFNLVNEYFYLSKHILRLFYQNTLNNRFLEYRDDALYPINNDWGLDEEINTKIAQFILTKTEIGSDGYLLFKLNETKHNTNNNQAIRIRLINLVLFYDANINIQNKLEQSILINVIGHFRNNNNYKDIIALLLNRGVKVNSKDNNGNTALHLAMPMSLPVINNYDIIKLLLNHHIDVNIKNNNSSTALHYAINNHGFGIDYSNIIMLLLAHGADVNISDKDGNTALNAVISMFPPANNHYPIILLILTHGANVNIQNNNGNTPLHNAINWQDFDIDYSNIIILLLTYGADVNIQNDDKDTALILAQKKSIYRFDKLIEFYSPQGTLKNLCLRFILTHKELFKDKLDTLPEDLRELFKF